MERPIRPGDCRANANEALTAGDPVTAIAWSLLAISCDLAKLTGRSR